MALSLGFLLACSPRVHPSLPARSSVEEVHNDPARDAHLKLLREAYRAFVQERYPTALLFFRRFVDSADRGAPRMAEARWWLGRSYEQLGDYRAAMAEYRTLAVGEAGADPQQPLYRAHALRRLDELRQVPTVPQAAPRRQMTIGVSLSQVPPVPLWIPWLESLLKADVTSLLIDPALSDGTAGEETDRLRALVEAAHVAGLAVWVSLDPHQGRGLPVRPEWITATVGRGQGLSNGSAGGPEILRHPDILHPDYQAAIEERVKVLLQTGCDGVFLQARDSQGFAKEYSEISYRLFASAFSVALSPQQLLGEGGGGGGWDAEREAQYWRWVGWKARGYAAFVARIRARLRDMNPTGRLLIEVHRETVNGPLAGLEQYGEDVAELLQRTGGAIVVRSEGAGTLSLPEPLAQHAGAPDRWWLSVAMPDSESLSIAQWVGTALATVPEQGNWNVLVRVPEPARFP
ncbi:MAG: hypothetical protein RI101_07870 [Nitrospira sp.]|nr:hypothetical protein [Nitrospira sp.]